MSEHDTELGARFMRFMGLLSRYQMQRFRDHGPFGDPHRGQGRVLSILKLQPVISQKELLYLLDMSKQSLGELLGKLERSGYITRTASEFDRRAVTIRLTPEGAAAADRVGAEQEEAGELFDCLSDAERENISEYLNRLTAELERRLGVDADEAPFRGFGRDIFRGTRGRFYGGPPHHDGPPYHGEPPYPGWRHGDGKTD